MSRSALAALAVALLAVAGGGAAWGCRTVMTADRDAAGGRPARQDVSAGPAMTRAGDAGSGHGAPPAPRPTQVAAVAASTADGAGSAPQAHSGSGAVRDARQPAALGPRPDPSPTDATAGAPSADAARRAPSAEPRLAPAQRRLPGFYRLPRRSAALDEGRPPSATG